MPDKRPHISKIRTAEELDRWYWLKAELEELCRRMGLPANGVKAELRERLLHALRNDGALGPTKKKRLRAKSKFPWAKAKLTAETVITDNVSFGPNFRGFFQKEIGARFVCTGEFMQWVRSHPGKTLRDAALHWLELEERKLDPQFQRAIASDNQLSQYVRDFLADNPGATFKYALAVWYIQRRLPA